MKVWNKPVNFEDDRGTIRDILTHTPIEHVTILISNKGSVRGNHYHKETLQYDYVINGRMKVLSRKEGSSEVESVIAEPGTLVLHEQSEAHAFFAIEDTVWLSITEGTRGGGDYEKDTYRLDEPLVDPNPDER